MRNAFGTNKPGIKSFPAFSSPGAGSFGTGTSGTAPLVSMSAGNLIVIHFGIFALVSGFSVNNGFTILSGSLKQQGSGGTALTSVIATKIATGVAANDRATFTWTGSGTWEIGVNNWSNCLGIGASNRSSGASATPAIPQLTTTADTSKVIAWIITRGPITATFPASPWEEELNNNGSGDGFGHNIARLNIISSGTLSDAAAFGIDPSRTYIIQLLELKSAG